MKKLVCVFLALIFFCQAAPLNAMAEALVSVPTAQELTAALALTGLDDDSPATIPAWRPAAA